MLDQFHLAGRLSLIQGLVKSVVIGKNNRPMVHFGLTQGKADYLLQSRVNTGRVTVVTV